MELLIKEMRLFFKMFSVGLYTSFFKLQPPYFQPGGTYGFFFFFKLNLPICFSESFLITIYFKIKNQKKYFLKFIDWISKN